MRIDRRDIAEALASGGLTFAWYALPDVVPSRRARGVAKVALMLPVVGLAVAQVGRAGASTDAQDGAVAVSATLGRIRELTATTPALDARAILSPADEDTDGRRGRRLPSPKQVALMGPALLVLAGTVAGTVAAERGIHRYGQRLGARGARLPHTRIGLVAGLATVGLTAATATLDQKG